MMKEKDEMMEEMGELSGLKRGMLSMGMKKIG